MKVLIVKKELIEDKGLENFLRARSMVRIARAIGVTNSYLSLVLTNRQPLSEKVYKKLLKYRDAQIRKEQPTS